MKRNETRSLRKAQILQYQKSGQTVEAWCRNHQIKAHTLRYWLSKVTKVKPAQETVPTTPWVALSPSVSTPSEDPGTITLRMGTAELCIAPGFDPHLLRQILHVLQGV